MIFTYFIPAKWNHLQKKKKNSYQKYYDRKETPEFSNILNTFQQIKNYLRPAVARKFLKSLCP